MKMRVKLSRKKAGENHEWTRIHMNGIDHTRNQNQVAKRWPLVVLYLWFLFGILLLVGCSSEPAKAPVANSAAGKVQAAPPKVERPDFSDIVRKAAATPSAAFEGKGWRPLV